MRAIVTVTGKDTVGIIGGVCTRLSHYNINILDISQTVLQGYFTMTMVVDASQANVEFGELVKLMATTAPSAICPSGSSGRTSSTRCTNCNKVTICARILQQNPVRAAGNCTRRKTLTVFLHTSFPSERGDRAGPLWIPRTSLRTGDAAQGG